MELPGVLLKQISPAIMDLSFSILEPLPNQNKKAFVDCRFRVSCLSFGICRKYFIVRSSFMLGCFWMGVNQTVFCTVKGLVRDRDRFLALELDLGSNKVWDLPGGKVRYREDPLVALKREVLEETGLEVSVGRLLGTWYFFRQGDRNQVVATLFDCGVACRNLVVRQTHHGSETFSQFKWVTKDEFLSDDFVVSHPSLKQLIAGLDWGS